MKVHNYCILLLFTRVVGQYEEVWTKTDDSKQARGMVGIDVKERNDIVQSITNGKWLECDGHSIPPHKINDNYCDCIVDGLDEPSTSACSGISKRQTQFWCYNNNVSSHYIPTSRVNDGVCDCCDGSDEFYINDIICANKCNEPRIEAINKLTEMKAGLKKKLALEYDMTHEMVRLKQDNKDRLHEIKEMDSAIFQLQLMENVVLATERRIRRYDIFDRWAGEEISCVVESTTDDPTCAQLQVWFSLCIYP